MLGYIVYQVFKVGTSGKPLICPTIVHPPLFRGGKRDHPPQKNTKFLIIKLRGDFSTSNWKKENVKPTQQNGGFRRSCLQMQRCNVLEKQSQRLRCSALVCIYNGGNGGLQILLAVQCRSNQHPRNYNPSFPAIQLDES